MITYEETLQYLYARLPVFHRDGPQAYKPGLDTIQSFCELLGNPHHQFKSIHVAGTNGKGSSSHWLAAIFQSAGYRTGLYTSPHLKDFRERIRINGEPIIQDFVIDFVQENRPFIENKSISFFEVTVAMAFRYFAEKRVEIAIIEVGLGGRLDSTNIIQPEVSVITNIGWDHMDLLGNTLEKIAYEKAGIIKADTPVVISEYQENLREVFQSKATQVSAPIFWADEFITSTNLGLRNGTREVEITYREDGRRIKFALGLSGSYQLKNLKGVLYTVQIMTAKGWNISDKAIRTGLREVTQMTGLNGRWQRIGEHPITYCDTAHNESGIEELFKTIHSISYQRLWLVVGFVRDKNLSDIVRHLPIKANYFASAASNPRALSAEELSKKLVEASLKVTCIPNVNEAVSVARQKADAVHDLVVVFGSTYLIAELNNL